MHTTEQVYRSTTPLRRNALPATARAVTGSSHGTNAIATMEVQ